MAWLEAGATGAGHGRRGGNRRGLDLDGLKGRLGDCRRGGDGRRSRRGARNRGAPSRHEKRSGGDPGRGRQEESLALPGKLAGRRSGKRLDQLEGMGLDRHRRRRAVRLGRVEGRLCRNRRDPSLARGLLDWIEVSAAAPRRGRIAGRFSAARLRLDDDRARGLPVRRGSDALALGIQELVEKEGEIRREERKRIARHHLLKGPVGLDRRCEPLGRVGEAAAQESSELFRARVSRAQLRGGRIERGPSPGHQLHQDRAERIDVGLFGEPTVGARLRRDVRRDLGRHPAAAEGRQDAVGDPEASDANDGVVGNRHEPGPQHAMEERLSLDRRLVRALEGGRDPLHDQQRVFGRNADAEGAHAREHRVERPSRGLVPGHEGDALDQIELGSDDDRVMLERNVAEPILPDRQQHRLRGELFGLEHAKADEAPLVGGIERAKDGAERILGELRDEQIVAEVPGKKGSGGAHASNLESVESKCGSRRQTAVIGMDISSFFC